MRMNREKATRMTLGVEGRWSDHPVDPGGKTMFGVTLETFREAKRRNIILSRGFRLQDLTPRLATKIYVKMYWNAVCGDQLPSGLDALVFDVQVNSGQGGRRLQKTMNRLFRSQLKVDNDIARQTIAVVNTALDKDPENVYKIMIGVASRRLLHWTSLRIWKTFKRGWARRGARVLVHATRIADGAV